MRIFSFAFLLLMLTSVVTQELHADEWTDYQMIEKAYQESAFGECLTQAEFFLSSYQKSTNYRSILLFAALSAVKIENHTKAEKFLVHYEEAFNDDPKLDAVKFMLIRTYLSLNKKELAQLKFDELKNQFPNSAYTKRADSFFNQAPPQQEKPVAETKPQKTGDFLIDDLYELYLVGRDSEFIIQTRSYIKANNTSEDIPDLLMILSICYVKTGQPDNALSTLDLLLKRYPSTINTSDALFLRSLLRWEKNDVKGANEDLGTLNSDYPKYKRSAKVKTLLGALK